MNAKPFFAAITAVLWLPALLTAQALYPATMPSQPVPNWNPATPFPYSPDMIVYVDNLRGSDTAANGSRGQPYMTLPRAYEDVKSQVEAGTVQHPAILLRPTTKPYDQLDFIRAPIEVGPYDQPNTRTRPTIAVTDYGFGFVTANQSNVYIHDLNITGSGQEPANGGIYLDSAGASNVFIENCVFRNFVVAITLISLPDHPHIENNAFLYTWNPLMPLGQSMTASSIYLGTLAAALRHNFYYHSGWSDSFNFNDPNAAVWIQFAHGVYDAPAGGAALPSSSTYEFYWDSASQGYQGRVGGNVVDSCVFVCNGWSYDAIVGPGYSDDQQKVSLNRPGAILNSVVFGTQRNAPPDYGGGLGLFTYGQIANCRFFSDSTFQVNPAITVDWNNSPMPSDISGHIYNCDGIWANAPIVTKGAVNDRTASTSIFNVTIRKPRPGEHVPCVWDYYGTGHIGTPTQNDEATAEIIASDRHDRRLSTIALLEWARQLDAK